MSLFYFHSVFFHDFFSSIKGEPAGGFPGSAKDGEEDEDPAAFIDCQGGFPSCNETKIYGGKL